MNAPDILLAPEMRAPGERQLVRTRTGLLIGSAYVAPSTLPTADAERLQRALLARSASPMRRRVAAALRPLFTLPTTTKARDE